MSASPARHRLKRVNNISRRRPVSCIYPDVKPFVSQVVLELCRAEQIRDTETIEMHLERIKALVSTWAAQVIFFSNMIRSSAVWWWSCFTRACLCYSRVSQKSSFQNQTSSIRSNCCWKTLKRGRSFSRFVIVWNHLGQQENIKYLCDADLNCDYLFQDVFPTDFGPDYDSALQVLMLDFLSRLERLLPVPDIQQVLAPFCHQSAFLFLLAAREPGTQRQPSPNILNVFIIF